MNDINRRDLLKGTAVTGVAAIAGGTAATTEAQARGNLEIPPEAVGLLFDSTLCVGCKACVTACKIANGKPMTVPKDKPYLDESTTLGPDTLNLIKMYKEGKAEYKDREEDGFAFMKHSCMHCVDPACVSACPVNAMEKQPLTGIVTYNVDSCIGCRYCVFSCPFDIPRFDYDSAKPEIHKCELCTHLWKDGGFSACADVCPTGATLYGPVKDLQAEVDRRKKLKVGEKTDYPLRSTLLKDRSRKRYAGEYTDHVYGEKEQGGTQVLMMSGVSFKKMGMPTLPERSYASVSETVQHTLYDGLILPIVALGGLVATTFFNGRKSDQEEGGDHE